MQQYFQGVLELCASATHKAAVLDLSGAHSAFPENHFPGQFNMRVSHIHIIAHESKVLGDLVHPAPSIRDRMAQQLFHAITLLNPMSRRLWYSERYIRVLGKIATDPAQKINN